MTLGPKRQKSQKDSHFQRQIGKINISLCLGIRIRLIIIVQRNLQETAIKWLRNYDFQASIKWMQGYTKLDEYEDIFIKGHEFIRDPIKRHLPLVYPEEIFHFPDIAT